MNHLDFVNEIEKYGVAIRSTKVENKEKIIEVSNGFSEAEKVIVKNFYVNYKTDSLFSRKSALQAIITKAIDMDTWKHSWHNDIVPENYEKFKQIIQQKIIDRAKEIDELLTVYFQINYEMSNNEVVS